MFSTIVFLAIFIGILLGSAALWAFSLWLGLRWAGVSEVTSRTVTLTTAIVIVGQLGLSLWMLYALPTHFIASPIGALAQVMLTVILQLGAIGMVFKARTQQVFQAWLLTLLVSVAMFVVVFLVVRPVLYEAYLVPTNAMAPTLLGTHVKSVCSECDGVNYGSPIDDRMDTSELPRMICDHFHVGPALTADDATQEGDRILVAKFLKPRRWDMIVFHIPSKPEMLDTKRLVGMPGETIQIKDGAIWANGQKLNPPSHLAELKYADGIPELPQIQMWGSANRPALLGKDEYFVLGDFTAQSADSRVWESGAAMHSPFAVPEAYVEGVVTHTFWPLGRARAYR